MRDMLFKTVIEFEDPDQAREMAALLTAEDDEQLEALREALRKLGEVAFGSKRANAADVLEAPRTQARGTFTVREAVLKGAEMKVVLEGIGDAGWLMGIALAMLADELGGAMQEATLNDPAQKTTFDLIWNGEKARYAVAAKGAGEDDEDEDENDEDEDDDAESYDEEDFEDDFRRDEF